MIVVATGADIAKNHPPAAGGDIVLPFYSSIGEPYPQELREDIDSRLAKNGAAGLTARNVVERKFNYRT